LSWTERFVRADADGTGNGTTDANSGANGSWTLAQALTVTTGAQPGHRVNVKAGTYASATTVRATATAGTETSPIWWRGYNTTIGDLDSDHATARPVLTWTGDGRFDINHQFQLFSSMDFSGATSNTGLVRFLANNVTFKRCSVANTNTGSSANASVSNSNNINLIYSSFSAASTTVSFCVQTLNSWFISGCLFSGGVSGLSIAGTTGVANCIFQNTATNGILISGQVATIKDCIFYNTGTNGINNSARSSTLLIENNIFSTMSIGIAYTGSGSRPYGAYRINNAFYSMTSSQESGFGDMPAFDPITLTADPFEDAAAGDFNINSNSGGGLLLRQATIVLP
jgi:hypothetical protein